MAESLAARMAREDGEAARRVTGRRFAEGSRPVIRWVKGDGRDDVVTRAAIGQATRLFGDRVDYCLCTNGLDAVRVRAILEWATEPVEWWPVTRQDNLDLAEMLEEHGCPPAHFGYWWKWFPERVRPQGPEWILDGDMVVTAVPDWFAAWCAGQDPCRVTQDDRYGDGRHYGRYTGRVDPASAFYSGLISLPPGLAYMPDILVVLAEQPLAAGHDGRRDMCEQGVIASAFQEIGALPIPLYEFPFGRAFEPTLDYGRQGDRGRGWGYHFGHAFRRDNPHFTALCADGRVLNLVARPDQVARMAWLGARAQWGVPGWTMPHDMSRLILDYAADFAGRRVLELGTSRGRVTAMLASVGCRVTSVDKFDRGAAANLDGLGVAVVCEDAVEFLWQTAERFDLIIVDLHGNAPADWEVLGEALLRCLAPGAMLLISNAMLWKLKEFPEETGVLAFVGGLGADWTRMVHDEVTPGLAVVARRDGFERHSARADADLRLWVDGNEIWPSRRVAQLHEFRILGPVRVIRVRSRNAIPADSVGVIVDANPQDVRRLGVAVRHVRLRGAGFDVLLTPDWPGFGRGFYASEDALRWSDGDGLLVVPLPATLHGGLTIEIEADELSSYAAALPEPPDAN